MKKILIYRGKIVAGCLAAVLAAGCMLQGNTVTAKAFPSKGTSVSGNVRVRDDANGNPTGSLEAGQEVSIGDEKQSSDGYTWYQITYTQDGAQMTGWVRSDLLSTDGTGDAQEPEEDEQEPETDTQEPAEDDQEPEDDAGEPSEDEIDEIDEIEETGDTGSDAAFQLGGEGYDFADSIPEEEIPKGFTSATITYAGAEVPAVRHEKADLFLLYLSRASEPDDKGFYVYDEARDTILPFVKKKMGNGYVIFTNVPEEAAAGISSTYTMGNCDFKAGSIVAYQQREAADNTAQDAELSDFYYLYGVSDEGEAGWYLYDSAKNSVQRSIANMGYTAAAPQEQPDTMSIFDGDSTMRMISGALGILCLLLLVLTIIFSIRYKRLRRDIEGELDAEDEFPDEGDAFADGEDFSPAGKAEPERKADEAGLRKKEEKAAGRPGKAEKKQKMPDEKREKPAERPKRSRTRTVKVEIPGGKVDMMDLDAEMGFEAYDGYDSDIPPDADYDLSFDHTGKEEPEYYDEEEPGTDPRETADDDLEMLS